MVKVKLTLPVDTTFLSETLYEGLLFAVANSNCVTKINAHEVEFDDTFLSNSFGKLKDYVNVKITLTGNDSINVELFKKLGLPDLSNKTINQMLEKIYGNAESLKAKPEIIIFNKINGKNVLYDVNDKKEGLSFQLLKLDRYTGFTSIETSYSSKQFTSYFSKELVLISLLGIYSSHIHTVYVPTTGGLQPTYYFIFFSPDETIRLFSEGDVGLVKKLFLIKDEVKDLFKKILGYSSLYEIMFLELILSVELHKQMEDNNLDKLSLILFRVNPEGQTYKVYEVLPIPLYKETLFHSKVRDFFGKNSEAFLESVSTFLNDKRVHSALSSLNKQKKLPEADQILKAVQNLYKFIVLGDSIGFSGFIKSIWDAHEKCKDSKDSSPYLSLIKRFNV